LAAKVTPLVAFVRLRNPTCGYTGVKILRYLLVGLLLVPGWLAAETLLESAQRAQAMLGPETWSRVIRIENTAVRSPYPATVYALAFEEAGILWFYTATNGTQSLTLHPDRLAEEKADLLPLLRKIEPGFARWSEMPDTPGENRPPARTALPNGCFVQSLAALRERLQRGERIERARLLSFYFDTPDGKRGHTVLTFETRHGLYLLDPLRSPEPRRLPRDWADKPDALAEAALPHGRVDSARWVPTAMPLVTGMLAAAESANRAAPEGAPRLMR